MKIDSWFFLGGTAAGSSLTTIQPTIPPCLPALTVAELLTDANPPRTADEIWTQTNADCYIESLLDTSRILSKKEFHDYLIALLSIAQIVEQIESNGRRISSGIYPVCVRLATPIASLVVEKHEKFWPLRFQYMHPTLLGNGSRDDREWAIRGLSWIVTPFWNLDNVCNEIIENGNILKKIMMQKLFRKQFIVGISEPRQIRHVVIGMNRENILRESASNFFGGNFVRYWRHGLIGGIRVKFSHEPAIDTGGVFLDWVTGMFRAFIHEEIFVPVSEDVNVFTVNSAAQNISDNYFRMAGIVLGLCLLQDAFIPVELSIGIFKKLTLEFVKFEELEKEDPILWKHLREYSVNDEIFFVVNDRLGNEIELIRDGASVQVTEENLPRFQRAMASWKLVKSVDRELNLLKEGFDLIVGENFFARSLTASELQKITCQSREPILEDLSRKLDLACPVEMAEQDRLIWRERLRRLIQKIGEENLLGDFIQFITGLRIVDSRPITIKLVHYDDNDSRFPTASTCTRTLRVPVYSSEEMFVVKMMQALEDSGSREFGLV